MVFLSHEIYLQKFSLNPVIFNNLFVKLHFLSACFEWISHFANIPYDKLNSINYMIGIDNPSTSIVSPSYLSLIGPKR